MTNNIINWLDILVFFFKESLKRETTFKADFSYLLVFPCTCSQDEDISVELACLRKEITHEHRKKKHLSSPNSPGYGVDTPSTRIQMLHVGIFQWKLFHELYTYSKQTTCLLLGLAISKALYISRLRNMGNVELGVIGNSCWTYLSKMLRLESFLWG